MRRSSILLATAFTLVATISMAFAIKSSSSVCLTTTPMGTTNMTGGTSKLGEIDPAATPTDASGTVCNGLGVPITDLTFSVQKGTATKVNVGGGSDHDMNGTGTSCKITLSTPLPTSGTGHCADYTIKGVSGSGSTNIVLNVTPSSSETISGNPTELNVFPTFQLDSMSDLARNGIAEVYYPGAVTIVSNADSSQHLNKLTGTVSFPGSASANLTGVQLAKADDSALSSSASISGNDFTVTSFTPLDPGSSCRVIVLIDADLGGQPMRLQLQATFAP